MQDVEVYDPLAARREAKIREAAAAKQKAADDKVAAELAAKAAGAATAAAAHGAATASALTAIALRVVRRAVLRAEQAERERVARERLSALNAREEVMRARLQHVPTRGAAVARGSDALPRACGAVPREPTALEVTASRSRAERLVVEWRPGALAALRTQVRHVREGRLQPASFGAWLVGALGFRLCSEVLHDVARLLPTAAQRRALFAEHHAARQRRELGLVQRNARARTAVELAGFWLGDAGAAALAAALRSNRRVARLGLADNCIGAAGVRALCSVLAPRVAPRGPAKLTLTSLDLGGNQLGDEGALALAALLDGHGALRRLQLRANALGNARTADAGLRALGAAVARCPSLRDLGLAANGMGAAPAPAVRVGVDVARDERFAVFRRKLEIGTALRAVKKLLRRHCARDGTATFSDADVAALQAWWEKRNEVVPEGDVEAGVRAVGAALREPGVGAGASLGELDLEHNAIGALGGRGLGAALRRSATLHTLRLRDNRLGAGGGAGLHELAAGLVVVHANARFRPALRQYRSTHDAEATLAAMSVEGSALGAFEPVELRAFADYLRSQPPVREDGVPFARMRMRAVGGKEAPPLSRALASRVLVPGVKVDARYGDGEEWFPATVAAVGAQLDDGFGVEYSEQELMSVQMRGAAARHLAVLELAHNRVRGRDVAPLAVALESNDSLTCLDVSANALGDGGALALAAALRKNAGLTSLGLASNGIGIRGCIALAEALAGSGTLLHCDLSWNPAMKGDVEQDHVPLPHVALGGVPVEALGLSARVEARCNGSDAYFGGVVTNRRVDKTLDIRFAMPAVVALARALGDNGSLTQVDCNGNELGTGGALALAGGLRASSTLTAVSLGNNGIGTEGTLALAHALEREGGALERVELSGKTMLPRAKRADDFDWLTTLELADSVRCFS
eukprot:g2166.t1